MRIFLFTLLISFGLNAQNDINPIEPSPFSLEPISPNIGTSNFCLSETATIQDYESMGLLNEYNSSKPSLDNSFSSLGLSKTNGPNTISVIFHVLYNPDNPAENVSQDQIEEQFSRINKMFNKLNIESQGYTAAADVGINFCMASKTPNGDILAEPGIIRVETDEDWYDTDNGEISKMKSSLTNGSDAWDRNQYLNIWVCDISNGAQSGKGGYAILPTLTNLPSASLDGIVLDYNIAFFEDSPALTHEIGHYLGLRHTWGDGGCSSDDGFTDTPNTAGPSHDYPYSCTYWQLTCTAPVQCWNLMDYSNCSYFFTHQQATYMMNILTGVRGSLLNSTACDNVNAPPFAYFTNNQPEQITIEHGEYLQFTDLSTNNPTSWFWDFGGGALNATVQNPLVQFTELGEFTVKLVASNVYGADSIIKTLLVDVNYAPLSIGGVSSPSICTGNDGSITVGGFGTGTVQWEGTTSGSSSNVNLPYVINNLPAGIYDVQFFLNGSGYSPSIDHVIVPSTNVPASPTITSDPLAPFCAGDIVTLTSDFSGDLLWSNGETSQSISIMSNGEFWLTYFDANGCKSYSDTLNIYFNPIPPTPTISPNVEEIIKCENYPVHLNMGFSSSVIWTDPDGNQTTQPGPNYFQASIEGWYYGQNITYQGCVSNKDSIFVSWVPVPDVFAGNDTTVCINSQITLTAEGANTYSWNNGVTNGQQFTANNTTQYIVTGYNSPSCFRKDTVIVTVMPNNLDVFAGNDVQICLGDSTTIFATGAPLFEWDNDVTNGQTLSPNETTTYTVSGYDEYGCQDQDVLTIMVLDLPTVSISPFPILCENYSPLLLSQGYPLGGIYSGNSVEDGFFDPGIGEGIHQINYEYVDLNGCANSASDNILVYRCLDIENKDELDFKVYPNPFDNHISIVCDGSFYYTLTDAHGKIVMEGEGSNQDSINLPQLSQGLFLLHLRTNEYEHVFRMLKM